uniref:RIMS-binding protein 2 n=1 Tax=Sander lucioperca TaxID=283035 RepID=A0A8C9XLX8_SANLU
MREVAERRQQLELEHEQALAILKFKQDEIKRLQRSKVRDLEDKCRSQSEQFGLLSQELEKFRLQASKADLSCLLKSWIMYYPPLPLSLSLLLDVAATLRLGATPHAAGLSRVERSPVTKHRELPTISVSKSGSSSSKSETTHLTPKSDTHLSPYNPYDGPNDNPEVELPLTAGEYIYVYGDMDDDGFYEGELMDGRRGLVPSNFVERVSDDDVMSTHASERTEASAASAPLTNGLDLDLEEVGVDIVPYPRKLTLIKQLAKSIIIGWDPPLVPAGWGNVWSYNVYVDQELRLNVPFGAQTKAVLERLDINLKAYRVSVQSLTEKGPSDQLRCSMLVGRDVCVAPTQLRVERITATSANLTWLPSNSNYVHIVSLNEEECELVKAGCCSLCLNNLLPSLQYTVKVEARPHRTPWELPVERREHRSATITFTTLMAGPPDAPLDVQLEHGPSPGIALISWLPVTIDAAGTSNGVRVTGYTIYADKKKARTWHILWDFNIHFIASYSRGLVEPPSDYHADNSRSDLSDILEEEEEEEELYSDHLGEAQARGTVDSPKTKGNSDIRIFVALFPYDPATMSPNPDAAEEELPFTEGQIIKVYGDKDADGFYRGESAGRLGYVPCNMVSEIQVEDEETRQQLLQQGFLSTAASMEKIGRSKSVGNPAPGARRMVAIFDYDPRESSPNTDIEAELTFSAGDIIHVFGDMDEDGFFYVSVNNMTLESVVE